MKLKLQRAHNMIPPHKWCVEEDRIFGSSLFFGTRKECEDFIRTDGCKDRGCRYVATDGSCLRCGADQGVACRAIAAAPDEPEEAE